LLAQWWADALSIPADGDNRRSRAAARLLQRRLRRPARPEDNVYGLPGGGEISFGGYGYGALIRPLSRGTHTLEQRFEGDGAPPPSSNLITVG
jgi:hypothetical protein